MRETRKRPPFLTPVSLNRGWDYARDANRFLYVIARAIRLWLTLFFAFLLF